MANKKEEALVEVIIKGQKANAALKDMEAAARGLSAQLKSLPRDSQAFADKKAELQKFSDKLKTIQNDVKGIEGAFGNVNVKIINAGNTSGASLDQLRLSSKALEAQINTLSPSSQKFLDKTKELQEVNHRIKSIENDVKGVGGVFQNIGKEIKGFGILAAGYLGFDWLTSSISGIIKNNAALSDSLADIRKTTGMTEAEAKKLNTAFGQIDTRTAAKDLREIAIVGGQLGIAKGDIFGFTIAVDKMNVALGDEFTGGAEEVTKAMGGLRNIFTDIKTDKVDQDLLHIGNAINELASSGAATGPVVSDFANRIGGVGISLGLTSGQVLGLSATLQELNVSTERGGTAVTKILQKMTTNTAEFAKVAGIPVKEFTELVNKDLYGAFVKVVEGSKKGNVSATEFGKTLDSLGVDGAGASEVFAKLGSNTKLLSDKVGLANGALKNTDSILAEFSVKNTTLAAEMDRLSKGFASAFTNSAVSAGLKSIVGGLANVFDNTKKLSDVTREEREELMLTETEIFSYNQGNETRTKLIKELQEKYPDFLKNIDAETVGNTELHNALDKVNASLVNKIVIQKKEEEIQELAEKAGEKRLAATEAKIKMQKALTEAYNSSAKGLQFQKEMEGLSLIDQAEIFNVDFKNAGLSAYNENVIAVRENLAKWKKLEAEAYGASIPLNEVLKEKSELMKELGIETDALSEGKWSKEDAEKAKAAWEAEQERKKREHDDQIKEYERLLEAIRKLEHEQVLSHLSTSQKEITIVTDKYDELRKQAKGHSEAIIRINALEDAELMDLLINQFTKEADAKSKADNEEKKRLLDLQKEKQSILKGLTVKGSTPAEIWQQEQDALALKWDEGISAAEAHNLKVYSGEEQHLIDIEKLRLDKQKALEIANSEHIATIDKQNSEANLKILDKIEKSWNSINQVTGKFLELKASQDTNELNSNQVSANSQIAQQKRLLDKKIISEKEYQKKVDKIEAEKANKDRSIKQEAAEREKKHALFTIAINTALGVVRALAQPIPNIPMAITIGAMGALEFGIVASKEVPKFATGGFNKKSNDPAGYTSGATLYTNSASGQNFIAGEAGKEWIAPNWMTEDPIIGANINALEAIRVRGFAAGGSTSTKQPSFESSTSTANQNYQATNISQLAAVVSDLNSTLQQIKNEGIEAHINYDIYQKTLNSFDSAKASAQVKN